MVMRMRIILPFDRPALLKPAEAELVSAGEVQRHPLPRCWQYGRYSPCQQRQLQGLAPATIAALSVADNIRQSHPNAFEVVLRNILLLHYIPA